MDMLNNRFNSAIGSRMAKNNNQNIKRISGKNKSVYFIFIACHLAMINLCSSMRPFLVL